MKASQVVWLGVKLQEELLKIWTHYKEKHGEQNSRYFEIWTFYMLLTSCVSIVVSGNFCCFKLAFPSLLFLSKDKVKLNTCYLHELIVGFFLRCELGLPVPIVDKYHHLTWFVSQLHNSTLYCFSSVSKQQKKFLLEKLPDMSRFSKWRCKASTRCSYKSGRAIFQMSVTSNPQCAFVLVLLDFAVQLVL